MRKNKHFALGTAALLLSTAGFTACSSDDAFTGSSLSGEAVKTQFAINIPTSGVKGRMTDVNTQNNNNFLGMHNIQLIPMTTAATTGATFSSVVNLGDIAATGGFESNKPNTKVYKDVNVPVGTTNFLFYGAGNTIDPTDDATDRFAKGLLNQDISGSSVDNIAFSLQLAKVNDNGQADILKGVLNNVAKVSNWGPDCANEELKDLYNNFITLKAGSANSICKTLEELYNAVSSIQSADGTVQQIVNDIKAEIVADSHFTYDERNQTLTADENLTYPQNMNMPDGAAALTFDPSAKEFSYNSSSTMGDMTLDMQKVCYPASIYYFVNTTVKASNNEQTTWPDTQNWGTSFTGSDWGNTVLATTRSIALKDPIQYGVAQLALTAKCDGSLLEDSKSQDGKSNKVSVPTNGYPITGVLIGGQPDEAGWDFNPKNGTSFTQVVYDNAINGTVAAKSNDTEGINYTLVLDNDNNADNTASQAPVNIAVEFENTGADFYGVNGQIIPKGAKFYLIAQLNPSGKTVQNYQGIPHVFMQDYTTTANLTIKSLANAYNTIPDLRASELSLGLTVDLDWKAGIEFNVDIN